MLVQAEQRLVQRIAQVVVLAVAPVSAPPNRLAREHQREPCWQPLARDLVPYQWPMHLLCFQLVEPIEQRQTSQLHLAQYEVAVTRNAHFAPNYSANAM